MAVTWRDNTTISHDQWNVERLKHLGASEIGTVVYGNRFSSNLEIFYEKVGMRRRNRIENIRMFLGNETEPVSGKMYCYYEGTEQSIVDNVRAGRKVKEIEYPFNKTAFNDKYPHLAASPDARIIASRGDGSLEIKNTTSWALGSYDTGLPTDNVIQIIAQMMITEWDYGELFYFIDNARIQLHPVERKDCANVEELILEHTAPFWNNVLKARPLFNQLFEAQRNMNMRLVNELQMEIARLEPPPQNTDGYLNFMSEKWKEKMNGTGVVTGTNQLLVYAKDHKRISKEIEALESAQRKIEIELKQAIGEKSMIDFGTDGKVIWAANKSGKRPFINKVK